MHPAVGFIAVDHNQRVGFVLEIQVHHERAHRRVAPIGIHGHRAIRQAPLHTRARLEQPQLGEPREEVLVIVYVERFAHGDQIRGGLELAGFGGFLCAVDPIPVEPGDLVVLAIRVVVAVLRVAEFVSASSMACQARE